MRKKLIIIFIMMLVGITSLIKGTYAASNYTLTVQYFDYNGGGEIAPAVVKSIPAGENYTTEQKKIKDYTLFETSGKTSGVMPSGNQIVKYRYKYNKCKITVKYYNDSTNELLKEETETGIEGDKCKAQAEKFDGLVLTSEPTDVELTFNKKDREVIFHYQKQGTINVIYADRYTSKILKRKILQDKINAKADIYSEKINNYVFEDENQEYTFTEDEQNIIVYMLYQGKINVNYVEKETGKAIDSIEKIAVGGTEYTSSAKKFDGYELVEKPSQETVQMRSEDITLTYYYKKLKPDFYTVVNFTNINVNGYYHNLERSIAKKVELTSSELENSKDSKIQCLIKVSNSGEIAGKCKLNITIPNGYKAIPEENPDFTINSDTGEVYINDIYLETNGKKSYNLIITKIDNSDPSGVFELKAKVQSATDDNNAENDQYSAKLAIVPITGKILLTRNILFQIILILFLMYIINSVRRKNLSRE